MHIEFVTDCTYGMGVGNLTRVLRLADSACKHLTPFDKVGISIVSDQNQFYQSKEYTCSNYSSINSLCIGFTSSIPDLIFIDIYGGKYFSNHYLFYDFLRKVCSAVPSARFSIIGDFRLFQINFPDEIIINNCFVCNRAFGSFPKYLPRSIQNLYVGFDLFPFIDSRSTEISIGCDPEREIDLLIAFGARDLNCLSSKLLSRLLAVGNTKNVHVIIGNQFSGDNTIKCQNIAAEHDWVNLITPVKAFDRLLLSTRILLTCEGNTPIEAFLCGCSTFVISQFDHSSVEFLEMLSYTNSIYLGSSQHYGITPLLSYLDLKPIPGFKSPLQPTDGCRKILGTVLGVNL